MNSPCLIILGQQKSGYLRNYNDIRSIFPDQYVTGHTSVYPQAK